MLLAHGIEIPDENILDTIVMSGLVLRGQPDKHRPGHVGLLWQMP
jgi:hypothetical protein